MAICPMCQGSGRVRDCPETIDTVEKLVAALNSPLPLGVTLSNKHGVVYGRYVYEAGSPNGKRGIDRWFVAYGGFGEVLPTVVRTAREQGRIVPVDPGYSNCFKVTA